MVLPPESIDVDNLICKYSEVIDYVSEIREKVAEQIDQISKFHNPEQYLREVCFSLCEDLNADGVAVSYINLEPQYAKIVVHSISPIRKESIRKESIRKESIRKESIRKESIDDSAISPLAYWKKLYEFEKLVDTEKVLGLGDCVSKMQFSVSDLEHYRKELDLPSGLYQPFFGRASITTPILIGDMGLLTCFNYENPRIWTDQERSKISKLTINESAILSKYFQLEEIKSSIKKTLGADELNDLFTGREREVLALLSNGLSNKEIASELDIAMVTVERHISKMFRKTHYSSRTELACLQSKMTTRAQILRILKWSALAVTPKA
jgi:DNA-binding CsgD family transcriptional regulator